MCAITLRFKGIRSVGEQLVSGQAGPAVLWLMHQLGLSMCALLPCGASGLPARTACVLTVKTQGPLPHAYLHKTAQCSPVLCSPVLCSPVLCPPVVMARERLACVAQGPGQAPSGFW